MNIMKTSFSVLCVILLSSCANDPWSAQPTASRTCVRPESIRMVERVNDHQVVVQSGARHYKITTSPTCKLPNKWFSVALSDSLAPVRYARHPTGQWFPVVERWSSQVCSNSHGTLVVLDNPLWSTHIPQQCKIVDIERLN